MTAQTKPKDKRETYYYSNGSVGLIYNYRYGKRHGRTTYYNTDGTVRRIYNHRNGKFHGPQYM